MEQVVPMKLDPTLLYFAAGFDGYCTAKPFGGNRESERAGDHNWEMSESVPDDGSMFCSYCGASAWFIHKAASCQLEN